MKYVWLVLGILAGTIGLAIVIELADRQHRFEARIRIPVRRGWLG